ncbi:MAG: SpoIIE family protein phosphatase [Methanomicrobiales archaeon]|nr:SpoIIE family protein phosphatase [Methanomicrobiales archaeon]
MNLRLPPRLRFNVRMKILVIFMALSLICMLVMGLAAEYTINEMGSAATQSSTLLGKEAIHDSTAALYTATEEYLLRVAVGQAELIDEIFWSSEAELNILAAHALSVQNNPAYIPGIRAYPVTEQPADPLAATVVMLVPGAAVSPADEEYRALAGMDDMLAAVYRTDGDLASVYVVTESGILQAYPWEQDIAPDFDFRQRAWFTEAVFSEGPVWTEPYMDASGHGMILTCAQAVRTKYGVWVVASDVTIDQLDAYTSITLGGKGSSLLVDGTGAVLNRPGTSNEGSRAGLPVPATAAPPDPGNGFAGVVGNMTAGLTGIERVTIDGTDTVVAYAPVTSLGWSYAFLLPASEVVAPIAATEGQIARATDATSAHIIEYTERLHSIFAGLCILLLLIVVLLSWYLARIITRPVDALREGTAVIGHGDLDFRLVIHSGDEFETLAASFNQMAADLKENIENLRRTTAEKERYTKELEIAKEIQESILPESVPAIPGFEVAAITIPAMEIGGDLYDFIPAQNGNFGFIIADVSGKGVSAALFMALSRTILQASGGAAPDPSGIIRNANRLIYGDGRSSMFITVFFGILDPEKKTFTYVNAGHNPPLLFRNGEVGSWLGGEKGIALGVVPEVNIKASTLELRPGDLLVLYTDGVTEAFNENDAFFGEERLLSCVSRHHARPVQEIADALLEEIRSFAGTAPQSDDITLVIIRVT